MKKWFRLPLQEKLKYITFSAGAVVFFFHSADIVPGRSLHTAEFMDQAADLIFPLCHYIRACKIIFTDAHRIGSDGEDDHSFKPPVPL